MSRLSLRVLLLALAAVASPATVFSAWGSATEDAPVAAARPDVAVATASGVALLHPRDGLVVAGQPATGDWSALAASGIRTVINLRPQAELQGRDERAEVAAAGMRYVELPVSGPVDITSENAQALSRLLAQADGPLLVHCASGNRVGGLLAVAMAQSGMPASAALDFGRRAGMTSIEGRTREVIQQTIEQMQALRCVAAREDGDLSQCPTGG